MTYEFLISEIDEQLFIAVFNYNVSLIASNATLSSPKISKPAISKTPIESLVVSQAHPSKLTI